MDTRELSLTEFADHMRVKRGAVPRGPPASYIEIGVREVDPEGPPLVCPWVAEVRVREGHPWHSEPPDEIEILFAMDLMAGERWANRVMGTRDQVWVIEFFCPTESRARAVAKWLGEQAQAAIASRVGGAVTSSR